MTIRLLMLLRLSASTLAALRRLLVVLLRGLVGDLAHCQFLSERLRGVPGLARS